MSHNKTIPKVKGDFLLGNLRQIATNPFGIIFNPVSIEKLISRVVNQDFFVEKDIFFHNGLESQK